MSSFTEYKEYKSPLAGRLNWLSPPPPPQASLSPFGIQVRGGHTLACGMGVGGTNADEGTNTMVLCILIPSLCLPYKKRYIHTHAIVFLFLKKLKSILSIFLLKTVRLAINEECSAPASLVCTSYMYVYCTCIFICICVHTGGGGGII
jgi:hypothetical protein